MRKISIWVMFVLLLAVSARGLDVVKPESLSLKAGPTEPGEKLSLVWVESFVYPKQVGDERIISLGVRTASKVKEVVASFDFNRKSQKLASVDGMSWSTAYKIPASVADGVHVVRYYITGRGGSIQRTVEFFIENPSQADKAAPDVSRGEVIQNSGWPLTIVSAGNAYTNNSTRKLKPGQVLVSLSRMQWYKVQFEDGQEGWVPGNYVKEPTEDYFQQGSKAYNDKNYAAAAKFYQNAVAIDPNFVKGYLWLAKSYSAQGDLDRAADAILQATRLDNRDMESRVMAETLANQFYDKAKKKMVAGNYHEAIAGYRQALDLKADLVAAWLAMGQCYRRLGIESEARDSWRMGLKADPDNRTLRAWLGNELVSTERQSDKGTVKISARSVKNVSSLVANDSLAIIKKEKTNKGTQIEAAIKSVIALTKSLGTPIVEKGWQIKRNGEKFLVSYLCEQSGGAPESFDWLVDVDTRHVTPRNENARVLMSRW
jgi:tetratricopeptide (TPR) repeat protein